MRQSVDLKKKNQLLLCAFTQLSRSVASLTRQPFYIIRILRFEGLIQPTRNIYAYLQPEGT